MTGTQAFRLALLLLFSSAIATWGHAQQSEAEFERLAAQLALDRLNGQEGTELLQEQALGILDRLVCSTLTSPDAPAALEEVNRRLEGLVSQQPALGEDYRAVALGSHPQVYVLAANFGLAGPSAVRLYALDPPSAGESQRCRRVARVDRYVKPDFFDEYLELVPIAAEEPVFVTVTGRTDEFKTGAFTAWRLRGERLEAVWSSEILTQSSSEVAGAEFRLAYCAEPDEDRPSVCRRMTRERYAWSEGVWKRLPPAGGEGDQP